MTLIEEAVEQVRALEQELGEPLSQEDSHQLIQRMMEMEAESGELDVVAAHNELLSESEDGEGYDSAEEAVQAWEEENGVELDDDQFEAVAGLVEARAEEDGEASVDEVLEEAQYHADMDARLSSLEQSIGMAAEAEQYDQNIAELQEATDAWDESFEGGVQRVEQELGRKLLEKERDQLRDQLPDATDDDLDVLGTWKETLGRNGDQYDHSTDNGRRQFMAERFRENDEPPPETVKPLSPDATDAERTEYMAARMNGAEIDESGDSEPVSQEA
jgi:hypothetical protein